MLLISMTLSFLKLNFIGRLASGDARRSGVKIILAARWLLSVQKKEAFTTLFLGIDTVAFLYISHCFLSTLNLLLS
jgi:hypothetical protein